LLLNDNDTPMDFVVIVLEDFFGMRPDEAVTQMLVIHNGAAQSAAPTNATKPRKKWRMF
jgi:ATP-dependent Clp protease adapter protein ClpS